MARQSHAAVLPPFLVTRPAPQGDRFAVELQAHFGPGIRICLSPLLTPCFLAPRLPEEISGVIFTSETGVAALARLRPAAGLPAWCVGDRTAGAARLAGYSARSAGGDADDLVAALLDDAPQGLLVHACGEDSRGAVARRVSEAGIPVVEATVYAQRPTPPGDAALRLLAGAEPVIVPLFSPRSASLFAAVVAGIATPAPLWIAALSRAVADACAGLAPARLAVARRPDATALLSAAEALIAAPAPS